MIINTVAGGENSWVMLGHVYFSREFSEKFVDILEKEYNNPGVDQMLWEDIYINHIDELKMIMRRYEKGEVLEFGALEDLRNFDESYRNNTRSQIIRNICSVLKCEEDRVINVVPIKKGLTNISFKFQVEGENYIYRHPGVGTEEIINRESEAFSQSVAKELGLDNSFIHMCAAEGWKVSKFIEGAVELNYRNNEEVKQGLALVKKLHDAGIKSQWEFNIFQEADKLLGLGQ